MPGREQLDDPVLQREVLAEVLDVHDRAVRLLRSAEPVASELYQLGYRARAANERRQAAAVAEDAATRFLDYLAEDPEATPHPLPPLENDWRTAA
ncbi:hypothetical protein ACH9DO_13785 [Kocuria sp. M1N1S27]|uniref:hypothetical protein n=1 Tax=Kocuria kalidii TaxID=3376283 RepID=UPI0037B2FFB7